ncbi:MAG: glutathione S-transferase C-terminal domain-containing protein [Pseudomonadota bacterium]
MGVMIDGVYQAEDPGPDTTAGGQFVRARSSLRDTALAPEPERYHLYVAWNCPWAHRALLVRAALGLEAMTISVAKPARTEQGWVFGTDGPFADPLLGAASLHEVYARQRPRYTGRITVPVLWDKTEGQIVNNESADIARLLSEVFDPQRRLIPAQHLDQIDQWNDHIHKTVNNGVYRAGFARTQEAYTEAVQALFDALDGLEAHLAQNQTLVGHQVTEADLRLFPTLARFDVAYHYAFKCNIRKLSDYPALWDYARALYALPGVAETVKLDIYKSGYFSKSELRNPLGIVPAGPSVDWSAAPARHLSWP